MQNKLTFQKLVKENVQLEQANKRLAKEVEHLKIYEESEKKLLQVYKNAVCAILCTNHKGEIVFLNNKVGKLFGYNEKELLYQNVTLMIPELLHQSHTEGMKNANEGKKGKLLGRTVQVNAVNREDKEIPIELSLSKWMLNGLTYYSAFIYDITERKEEEKKKVQADVQLKQSNNRLEQFAYMSSHDLRSPVNNLQSLLKLLDKDNLGNEMNKEITEKIEKTVNRLENTLNDLTTLVEASHEQEVDINKISFEKVLQGIKESIGEQIEESNAEIRTDFAVSSINYVSGHIKSILQNLLTNAIKYRATQRKPIIDISTTKKEEYVCLSVKDNGKGLDMERYGHQIFGMFKRFHQGTEGKGMGLYLIKTQVEALGGKVDVESSINKGTTFTIYLKEQPSKL